MNHVKTVLFLILCVAVGVGIGKGYLWWRDSGKHSRGMEKIDSPIVKTGEGDAPLHRGFAIPAAALSTLTDLLQQNQTLHATTIGIEYQPGLSRENLTAAVMEAHKHKNAVVLLPPPVFAGQNPYPVPLASIAADAQAAHVDFLTISWLSTLPPEDQWTGYWLPQCQQVRAAYNGKIILAATGDVVPLINQWGEADVIGAIGPFRLARRLPVSPPDVNVHDMRIAWNGTLSSLESIAAVHKKTLALLHMNLPLEVSARMPAPGAADVISKNPALQDTLYQALLLETKGRPDTTDMLLFNWGAAAEPAAPNNVPGMLPHLTDAWDPKKPATQPLETPPDTPDDATDAGTPETTATKN